MNFKSLSLALLLIPSSSYASQYAIQLEASRKPQLEKYEHLKNLGQLYTEATDSAYIRTRLGPFNNKEEALEVLNRVHKAGYTDAILTRTDASGQRSTMIDHNTHSYDAKDSYDIETFDVKTLPVWQKLSKEQKENVVYLDGVLHVKDGDTFTPLTDIVK